MGPCVETMFVTADGCVTANDSSGEVMKKLDRLTYNYLDRDSM